MHTVPHTFQTVYGMPLVDDVGNVVGVTVKKRPIQYGDVSMRAVEYFKRKLADAGRRNFLRRFSKSSWTTVR